MKNVPVDDHGHVNIEKLIEIIEEVIEEEKKIKRKRKEITPLLSTEQFKNLKKKLIADKKSQSKPQSRKDIFEFLFLLIKPNSEFDFLFVLKVE